MKQILFILSLLLFCSNNYAQTNVSETAENKEQKVNLDSIVCRLNTLLQDVNHELYAVNSRLDAINNNPSLKGKFKLYPTENIYTFIKLDTQTGLLDQVQWTLNGKNEFALGINFEGESYGIEYEPGTFELYPTKNMYQFLMINKVTGEIWHVQWGMKPGNRWVRKIC